MRTHILMSFSVILVLVYIFLGMDAKASKNDSLPKDYQIPGFGLKMENGDEK